MDFDIRIAFVILEADVVMRAVLLDQVHLEDERFQLGTHHDPLNVGDLLNQLAGLDGPVRTVPGNRSAPGSSG